MGKKRRDEDPDGVSMGDSYISGEGARWIGKTDSAPERKPPADTEASGTDVVEEPETYGGGKTAERRRDEG